MDHFEDRIYKLIEPVCASEGIYLYSASLHGTGKNRTIKVIVDTESGVTLNQCQQLSQKISDVFYRKEVFQGEYRLEVSSPGINKPLERPFEYKRSIGRMLNVQYHEGGNVKSVSGELISFDGDSITLDIEKNMIVIPLSNIEKAKIQLKW